MTNYEIKAFEDENGSEFYCVYEMETRQIIECFYFFDDALKYEKFLNMGGAFDGFTPEFMLNEVHDENNPNQEFITFFDK